MKNKLIAVDLFCGGGGTSTGLLMACEALGIDRGDVDLTAVNHWPLAIETHAANHPNARHLCERIEKLQPERIVPGSRADLLWASPECIHHSTARGGKPCNDQSRSQACGANRKLGDPLPTITTQTRGMGLLTPFLANVNHGTSDGENGRRVHGLSAPLGTLTTKNGLSIVRPFLVKYYGTGAAVDVESPLDAVTTDDRFGLVRPMLVEAGGERWLLDILFRMLTPAELAAAHSFPTDYKWCGNKSDVVRQIGNSVPIRTASALCLSQLRAS